MAKLNLLPTKEKNLLKRERFYQLIAISLIIFIIGTCLVALELSWAKQLLKDNFPSYDLSLNRNKALIENIKDINSQLVAIDGIQKGYISTSPLLISLSQITSNDLEIKSFNFSQEKKDFQLKGWSKNRETLLKFKNDLEKIEFFKEVETPISNLLKQEDIDFEFSGELDLSL
jgi:hypothetical protein